MNASLQGHKIPQAKEWLALASEQVRQDPQVMREHERYLTMTGNYAESADLGYKVIEKLPKDREGVDYLAYDLLFLKRDDEAMKIVDRYRPVLADDRDLPLIAGYVHASRGEHEAAAEDFTRALEIEPNMAVGYMNRGYVYNDMRLASKAERDFKKALALNPQYGEAHLGLAYALLQLRHSTAALKEAEVATRLLPESESLHLVKAEAYRQRTMLVPAETEYRAALKLNPNAATTYLALADVQYRAHKYSASADTLSTARSVAPNDPMISAQLGRSYARLGRSSEALQAVDLAERTGGKDYKVLLVSADALRILGRHDPDHNNNFEFLVAQGNVYRQRGQNDRALETLTQASQMDPQDPGIHQAVTELAETQGRPIIDHLGLGSDVRLTALFEDENIY